MAKVTRLTTKISIVIDGEQVEATVTGNYSPPMPSYKYEVPPEDASFEIDIVEVDGVDITDTLDAKGYDFADIEEMCLSSLSNTNQ
jgi:archaellum component FlaF (FlaF/FlaG flagellin family)